MEVCLLWVLCVWGIRGLCDGPIPRPGESYLVCVRPRPLNFEAAEAWVGLQRHIKYELKFRYVSENTAFYIFSNASYHTQLTAMYV